MPRMWGGDSLRTVYEKPIPKEPIGEAWLISDHPQHSSIVAGGPERGRSLHDLLRDDAASILGTRAALTIHGRFPLLLKILDAHQKLSIQVHPDDALAKGFGEDDGGKTEMWHILQTCPDAKLYCGLPSSMGREEAEALLYAGTLSDHLTTIVANAGESVFVPAGIIHAIGEGYLLAEIQQNSDLTYRMDDWGRVDAAGHARELHLDKAKACVRYPNTHPGIMPKFTYVIENTKIHVLTACPFFATEEIEFGTLEYNANRGETFQIILAKRGQTTIRSGSQSCTIEPGAAALVAGSAHEVQLSGSGSALMYYVPDIQLNIIAPLLAAGYSAGDLMPLLGETSLNETM